MRRPVVSVLLATPVLGLACALFATALLAPTPARADERMTPVTDPATKKECGACHMAFPPGLLPASSWKAVMGGLSNHFGEDASLPDATAKAIESWLVAHAAREPRNPPKTPWLRISDQPWWQREHRRVKQAEWDKAKSKANCQACHKQAASGVFEDD